jgi:hypothetical protein
MAISVKVGGIDISVGNPGDVKVDIKPDDHKKPDHHHKENPDFFKLWITDGEAKEGDKVDFYVKLDHKADRDIVVKYWTFDGTAKAWKDYKPEWDTVVIKKDTDSAKIDIKTIEDHKKEPTEYFFVKIDEKYTHVVVKDDIGKGTIFDDDHHHHGKHHDDPW